VRQRKVQQRWMAKLVPQQLLQPLQQCRAPRRKNRRILGIEGGISSLVWRGGSVIRQGRFVSSGEYSDQCSAFPCQRLIFAEILLVLFAPSKQRFVALSRANLTRGKQANRKFGLLRGAVSVPAGIVLSVRTLLCRLWRRKGRLQSGFGRLACVLPSIA
jgi:hypothetical protein